jgi:hypothetical protein
LLQRQRYLKGSILQGVRQAEKRSALHRAEVLLKRMSLGSSVAAFWFCFSNTRDPIIKIRLPFLPNRIAERMMKNSAVVITGCWNTMAAAMPASSTARFSVTIGNGIPRHMGEDDDVVDMMVRYLLVKVMLIGYNKKAGSDIQNRLVRLYELHEIM